MATEYAFPDTGFKKILYVTDLSENSRVAFPVAASMARHFNAELTVFHVVETEHFEKYLSGYISEEMWDQIKQHDLEDARQILVNRKRKNSIIKDSVDRICQEALVNSEEKDSVAYDVVVRLGDPADRIVSEAESEGYDLVVIGNHGKRSLKESLIGSTARRVLATCKIPVLSIPVPW